MFRSLFGRGRAKPPHRGASSREYSSTPSLKDRLIARFEQDTNPIGQQAIVQPFRRFDESDFAADPRHEAVATALAMTTYEWLSAVFNAEIDFYPNVRPADEMCADLSAFIAARLASRAQTLGDVKDIDVVSAVMYPSSEKASNATAILSEFESAEHDPIDPDLTLNWARTVRAGVDSLIVGDADKYVNAENTAAVIRRITVLPATLPYDNVLPDTIDELMAEMGRRR
jgi:hypothetical protein